MLAVRQHQQRQNEQAPKDSADGEKREPQRQIQNLVGQGRDAKRNVEAEGLKQQQNSFSENFSQVCGYTERPQLQNFSSRAGRSNTLNHP